MTMSLTKCERFNLSESLAALSTKELIKAYGGWNEGHFEFRTGEHGNGWINKMEFLRYPEVMNEMGRRLAAQYSDLKDEIEVVMGPSYIGSIIAYSVASHLNVPFSLTYRDHKDGDIIKMHRGFVLPPRTKILFVDDFVFTGTDLKDNVGALQNASMDVLGASVIGIRNHIELGVPIRPLMVVDFIKTAKENCRMCIQGIDITATNVRE